MTGESAQPPQELRERTKGFALRVIRLYGALPRSTVAQVVGNQALRSATSVGAHYCEAKRAKSNADMISKLESALQELDETAYWLELLAESGVVAATRLGPLQAETDALIAIFTAIVKKVKGSSSRGK